MELCVEFDWPLTVLISCINPRDIGDSAHLYPYMAVGYPDTIATVDVKPWSVSVDWSFLVPRAKLKGLSAFTRMRPSGFKESLGTSKSR